MFEPTGRPRTPASGLYDALSTLSVTDLGERSAESDLSFRDQGITFGFSGEDRPFPLDPIPRLVSSAEWATIEQGVAQRVRALEMFLADAYGPQEAFNEGVVPRRLLATSRHFWRNAFGVGSPNGVRIHVAGIDLVKDAQRSVLRARGQRAHPFRRVLCHREPSSDGAYVPRAVAQATGCSPSPAIPLSCVNALQASAPRAAGNEPNGGRAHAGSGELGLLRALVPGSPDGRRARRGP